MSQWIQLSTMAEARGGRGIAYHPWMCVRGGGWTINVDERCHRQWIAAESLPFRWRAGGKDGWSNEQGSGIKLILFRLSGELSLIEAAKEIDSIISLRRGIQFPTVVTFYMMTIRIFHVFSCMSWLAVEMAIFD